MKWITRQAAQTGIIAAAVAAITAAVMAGAPAFGQSSAPRPATAIPVIKSGFKNGPVSINTSGSPRTVASLSLPKGSWAIFAKAYLQGGSTAVLMNCVLVAGGDFDVSRPLLETSGGSYSQSIALNVVHKFAASGKARLQCATFGVPVSVNFIKITAIKAGSLTNTALP